jgi:hypothetical protein
MRMRTKFASGTIHGRSALRGYAGDNPGGATFGRGSSSRDAMLRIVPFLSLPRNDASIHALAHARALA